MKESDLTENEWKDWGRKLARFNISANYGILGKRIIQLNAEIYCWESVMTISKPIWNEVGYDSLKSALISSTSNMNMRVKNHEWQ